MKLGDVRGSDGWKWAGTNFVTPETYKRKVKSDDKANAYRNSPEYRAQLAWVHKKFPGDQVRLHRTDYEQVTGKNWHTPTSDNSGASPSRKKRKHSFISVPYVRGKATGRHGRERNLPKGRRSQHKLERWVRDIGIRKLCFDSKTYYVVDNSKGEGFDFEVRRRSNNALVARVDAKSQFTTTKYQDVQLEQAWKVNVLCFIVNYNFRTKRMRTLHLTPDTKRNPNGSIWG